MCCDLVIEANAGGPLRGEVCGWTFAFPAKTLFWAGMFMPCSGRVGESRDVADLALGSRVERSWKAAVQLRRSRGKEPPAIHRGPLQGRRVGKGRSVGVGRRSRGKEPLAIHRGPLRGRREKKRRGVGVSADQGQGAPGYSPRPASGPRSEKEERRWRGSTVQGQGALGYSPRPTSGPKSRKEEKRWRGSTVQGQGAPGYSPRPASGPKSKKEERRWRVGGPGARSPWLFTVARIGAEE